jgi:hypothetical protein
VIVVYFAVEGETDVPIAERMLRLIGVEPVRTLVAGGKSKLDSKIPGLNRSGANLNWLIMRDLDRDQSCPPELVLRLLSGNMPSPRVSLRVPVRSAESWILADVDGFSQEFSVGRNHVPGRPDDLESPKREVVNLCRRSRRSEVKETMVPRAGGGRLVGPEYANRIIAFVRGRWDPERAARRSPSLCRSMASLQNFVDQGVWS